jgi:hypothetical protein
MYGSERIPRLWQHKRYGEEPGPQKVTVTNNYNSKESSDEEACK